MKATSLFGGVQVIKILISIVRSKFIAVLLGPTGMGIASLLTSTTGLIESITNFGIGTSAVKDVAAANATGNNDRISLIVSVLRRWVFVTGLLGLLITMAFSSVLSELAFKNRDYTVAFLWISATLFFNQLCSGQLVVLQGMRKLQSLAKASLYGSLVGLFTTVPLYYYFGLDGIVPGIIISSLTALIISWLFAKKINIESVVVSRKIMFSEGKNMLFMGIMISLTGLLTVGASYIIRIFISRTGGVDEIGLYNAGFMIINSYVGLIFTAMSTDYYPRLSAVCGNTEICNQTVNQQAEIAILIIAPMILIFLVFINWIVVILYSTKFIAINNMIHWAVMGMFFKTLSWAIAFILLAKGNSKLFFWNEFIAIIYMLLLSLLGYKFYGLTGLGISFLVGYLIYFLQVLILSWIKYKFSFKNSLRKITLIHFLLALICFIMVKSYSNIYSTVIGIILIIISCYYSYVELNKKLALAVLLRKYNPFK